MCRFYPSGRHTNDPEGRISIGHGDYFYPPGFVRVCKTASARHVGRKIEVTVKTPWRRHVTRAEAEAGRLAS